MDFTDFIDLDMNELRLARRNQQQRQLALTFSNARQRAAQMNVKDVTKSAQMIPKLDLNKRKFYKFKNKPFHFLMDDYLYTKVGVDTYTRKKMELHTDFAREIVKKDIERKVEKIEKVKPTEFKIIHEQLQLEEEFVPTLAEIVRLEIKPSWLVRNSNKLYYAILNKFK